MLVTLRLEDGTEKEIDLPFLVKHFGRTMEGFDIEFTGPYFETATTQKGHSEVRSPICIYKEVKRCEALEFLK